MVKRLLEAIKDSGRVYSDADEMAHLDLASSGPEEDFSAVRSQAEALSKGDVVNRYRSDDPAVREQALRDFGAIVGPMLAKNGILTDFE